MVQCVVQKKCRPQWPTWVTSAADGGGCKAAENHVYLYRLYTYLQVLYQTAV